MFSNIKTIFLGILILFSIVPVLCFALPETPETINDVQTFGQNILKDLPQRFKEALDEAIGIWEKMYQPFKAFFSDFWANLVKAIKERIEIAKGEFPKEREEMQEDLGHQIPDIKKNVIEKVLDYIKDKIL